MAALAALPDGSHYNVAIQNPSVAFKDPRLKAGRPVVDRFGLPVVSAGGFAVAYRLETPSGSWAVRCFTRTTEGLERRYTRVARFLRANPAAHWMPVEYQPDGLLVERQWWPITVMHWVDALPLNEWVEGHLASPLVLREAAERFAEIVRQVERIGAAHGDLQHGNILVRPNRALVLIDYDGMFVPGLEGQEMPEVGHPNYQHPGRGAATFGPGLDRYSAAVIWTALTALARMPHLWDPHNTDDNLLFRARDFQDPAQSELLQSLRSNANLAQFASSLEQLLHVRVDRLPALDDFVAGKLPDAEPVPINFGSVAPYPVLDLRRPRVLEGRQGQRVTAVGGIVETHRGKTYRGDSYLFITIDGRRSDSLRIVLWSETLNRMNSTRMASLRRGTAVGVTGVLGEYKGMPQIVLERPALLELLPADRIMDLLGSKWTDPPPEATARTDLAVGDVVEHDKFGQGVVVAMKGDVAHIRFAAEVKRISYTTYPLRFVHRPVPQSTSARARSPRASRQAATPGPTVTLGRRSPSSGFARQQEEWEWLIASGSDSDPRPASAQGNAPVGQVAPASVRPYSRPPSSPTSQGQPRLGSRVVLPAAISATALAAAFLVAPSDEFLALGLTIAGLVSGGLALIRLR